MYKSSRQRYGKAQALRAIAAAEARSLLCFSIEQQDITQPRCFAFRETRMTESPDQIYCPCKDSRNWPSNPCLTPAQYGTYSSSIQSCQVAVLYLPSSTLHTHHSASDYSVLGPRVSDRVEHYTMGGVSAI